MGSSPSSAGRGKRILIVEDDTSLRQLLTQAISEAGYETFPASNGFEAITILKKTTLDLMITDLIMPRKEGIETILECRRINATLPIIAMSGGGHGPAGNYLTVAQKLGARHILNKPFRLQQIFEAIEDILIVS